MGGFGRITMRSIYIVEDSDKSGLTGIQYLTPSEAEGEIIETEIPGTMGKKFYEIVDVDMENEVTLIEDVITGDTLEIGKKSFALSYYSFSTPRIGSEDTGWWVEHKRGNGEWVRVTPITRQKRRAVDRKARYTGHEQTRVCSKSVSYFPDNVISREIWANKESDFEIYHDGDVVDIDKVYQQIDPQEFGSVGEVYIDIDNDNQIIDYTIDHIHKSDTYSSPARVLGIN